MYWAVLNVVNYSTSYYFWQSAQPICDNDSKRLMDYLAQRLSFSVSLIFTSWAWWIFGWSSSFTVVMDPYMPNILLTSTVIGCQPQHLVLYFPLSQTCWVLVACVWPPICSNLWWWGSPYRRPLCPPYQSLWYCHSTPGIGVGSLWQTWWSGAGNRPPRIPEMSMDNDIHNKLFFFHKLEKYINRFKIWPKELIHCLLITSVY